ncbi:MAG: DUF3307 domain-containing protein [bacterium]
MNIFLLLLLSFLIADFPFQTNWVFNIRNKYNWGKWVHVSIHTITTTIFLTPYLYQYQTWLIIFIITITHYIIDHMKKPNIWLFFLDQIMHLGVITICALALRGLTPMFLPDVLTKFFLNNYLLMFLIGFFTATFAGTIFIYFTKLTWRENYKNRPILTYEKVSGALDRGIVYSAFIAGIYLNLLYLIVMISPIIIRLYLWQKMKTEEGHFKDVYLHDIIVSFVFTVIIAFIVYACIRYILPNYSPPVM